MADALRRQWLMLSFLPRAPRKLDGASLELRLRDRGILVNRRTIQRDLMALSDAFPILCDERTKPYGWAWAKDAPSFEMHEMSAHVGLALKLALEMLSPIMPSGTVDFLRAHAPSFELALGRDEVLVAWVASVASVRR